MKKINLSVERCKGCMYCIEACPKDAISLSDYTNKKGYKVIKVDEDKCISCGSCYRVCPDYVFEIL